MSTLLGETLLTLTAAAKLVGKTPTTVRTWVRNGTLEWISLPSGPHTSVEAVHRMTRALTESRRALLKLADKLPSAPAQTRHAKRIHDKAVKVLKRMGMSR